jgi:hypothetical protein
VQVTRNVPPKRVVVTPGNTVVYAGKAHRGVGTYIGPDGKELVVTEAESFLCGEGPVADQLAFAGHVVVSSHEEIAAWNGSEGDEIRKAGLAEVDSHHKAAGTTRDSDNTHGFAKYEHADGADATPVDVTQHRQQVGQRHLLANAQATASDFGGKKGGKS